MFYLKNSTFDLDNPFPVLSEVEKTSFDRMYPIYLLKFLGFLMKTISLHFKSSVQMVSHSDTLDVVASTGWSRLLPNLLAHSLALVTHLQALAKAKWQHLFKKKTILITQNTITRNIRDIHNIKSRWKNMSLHGIWVTRLEMSALHKKRLLLFINNFP